VVVEVVLVGRGLAGRVGDAGQATAGVVDGTGDAALGVD
jgi:hypothetical protein